jgi:UDP-N-acetylglucosamine/UDP-N-acetylgalactosamine diphosphorylase
MTQVTTIMVNTTAGTTTDVDIEKVRKRYNNAGQGHVFDYYDLIESNEKKQLFVQQLNEIDVENIASLHTKALEQSSIASSNQTIQPFTGNIGRSNDDDDDDGITKSNRTKWYATGINAIRNGQVAALVLAGGQGTRLGYNGPKGMYQLTHLPSSKSLFQLMCERIRKLNQLATTGRTGTDSSNKNTIPFYVMTSPLNHNETVSYFDQNNYFSLEKENIFFFQQGMLPCLTNDGKIILEDKDRVAMAPDGNGGIYPSLQTSGAINHMIQEQNIQYLHVFSIDNALVKPADPMFIGYCIEQNADCGNKVVWKQHAHEAVGVMAVREYIDTNTTNTTNNNTKVYKPCIVEYSEITKDMAEQINVETNQLVFGAGNICNHFYTIDFIKDIILPNMGQLYHMAHKKIPYYNVEIDSTTVPTSNNGIKLETFIFDVFPLSERMCIYEVLRNEEFAPVKNQSSVSSNTITPDTPESASCMISQLAKEWVMNAGGTLIGDSNTNSNSNGSMNDICEISPLTSYAGEGLEEIVKGKEIQCPFHL